MCHFAPSPEGIGWNITETTYDRFDLHRHHRAVLRGLRGVRPPLREDVEGAYGKPRCGPHRPFAVHLLGRGHDPAREILTAGNRR